MSDLPKIAAIEPASMQIADGSALVQRLIVPEPNIAAPPVPFDAEKTKDLLRGYYDKQYTADMAAVFEVAQSYVLRRANEVKSPAVVLDIDETSLSNWPHIATDDFALMKDGSCNGLPQGPCGFDAWLLQERADGFPAALKFFNAVKSQGVAVLFITSRREGQRQATVSNLGRAGYEGWAKLAMRPEQDGFQTVEAFKTDLRVKLFGDGNYTLIANIGDQLSDIQHRSEVEAGKSEYGFKLPNPFYVIR
jgi:predicted secreted acid phosphatase